MEIKPLNIKDGSKYKVHPICELFPVMDDADFKKLSADIKANGLLEPIVIYKGRILDGRHRHKAGLKAKVKTVYEEFIGEDAEALSYVLSKNIHRRHLTRSQLGAIMGKAPAILKAEDGPSLHKSTPAATAGVKAEQTTQKVAEKAGISGRTLRKGRQLNKEGGKAVIDAVVEGKLSLDEGLEVAELPKSEQKEAVAEKIEEKEKPKPPPKKEKPPKEEAQTYDCVYVHSEFSAKELGEFIMNKPKRGHLAYIRFHPSDVHRAFDLSEAWGTTVLSIIAIKKDKAKSDNITRGDHDMVFIVGTNDDITIPIKERLNNCVKESEFITHIRTQEGRSNLLMGDAKAIDGWTKL